MVDLEAFKKISTFIFDVDGVFTNSQLLITEEGHFLRSMNVRDGYAVKVAIEQGFRMIIITGGSSAGVTKRLKGLGIHEVHTGVWDKGAVLTKIISEHQLTQEEILYMGDDIMDMECIKRAGIGICPKDSASEVLEIADHITQEKGGQGCIREVIQKVLELQSKWLTLGA